MYLPNCTKNPSLVIKKFPVFTQSQTAFTTGQGALSIFFELTLE